MRSLSSKMASEMGSLSKGKPRKHFRFSLRDFADALGMSHESLKKMIQRKDLDMRDLRAFGLLYAKKVLELPVDMPDVVRDESSKRPRRKQVETGVEGALTKIENATKQGVSHSRLSFAESAFRCDPGGLTDDCQMVAEPAGGTPVEGIGAGVVHAEAVDSYSPRDVVVEKVAPVPQAVLPSERLKLLREAAVRQAAAGRLKFTPAGE